MLENLSAADVKPMKNLFVHQTETNREPLTLKIPYSVMNSYLHLQKAIQTIAKHSEWW